ncbi:type IV pilus modification protein PilV [Pseudoxanthomonas putridarboris]|uniref:Type IV pilus modification protein PilV n=1 Tax=Pseudoxanthomonas putridarboris TaxID=752605 RepID=A0ABU9J010_9GAMM
MNTLLRSGRKLSSSRSAAGFTLLEVLIAMLVLAFGLLGFALLQTMSVRFTQSANQRTKATDLAYDLLDQMRSNRLLAAQYTAATFPDTATGNVCLIATGSQSVTQKIAAWQCTVRRSLGEGSSANVTLINGQATVTLTWGDQRWERDTARTQGAYNTGTLTLTSRL